MFKQGKLEAVAKKAVPPTEHGIPVIELDDDSENWMQQHRLEKLRARGWQGTVGEYMEAFDRLGGDPLEQDPPITR